MQVEAGVVAIVAEIDRHKQNVITAQNAALWKCPKRPPSLFKLLSQSLKWFDTAGELAKCDKAIHNCH
jgi:hypothetical protein